MSRPSLVHVEAKLSFRDHLSALAQALVHLDGELERLEDWGERLARVLLGGGRLLAVGNGGSAAQAQHLTGELVGKYRHDRLPLSAIALCAESASLTAIVNDYGPEEAFARQVRAHGRPGDVLVALSTSGRSANVLAAVDAARSVGLSTWALAGPSPNPLGARSDEALCVEAAETATVQEVHLVAVHLLCEAVEAALGSEWAEQGRFAGRDRPVCLEAFGQSTVESSSQPSPRPRTSRRRGRGDSRPLVVVGDALLDRDLDGRVERLCPDAPVPVVEEPTARTRPGGAGLAAALAAVDGRPVTLVTALGDDEAGREVARLLDRAGVELVDLGNDASTPEKVRVRAGGRSLLRIDYGVRGPGRPRPVNDAVHDALCSARGVLVADYGRGLAAEPSLRAALEALSPRVPVVWDPHLRGAPPIASVRLATPNRDEAAGLVPQVHGEGLAAVTARARRLAEEWRAAAVAVTMGERGALLVAGDAPPLVVPTSPAEGDVCGAGDCFAAAAVGLLADGALPSEAVVGAVSAAADFVAGGGASALDLGTTHLDRRAGEAHVRGGLCLSDPLAVIARVRAFGGTVVATGGCFDILHPGHLSTLRGARALGDCLVVCLNSDESVRRLKGPDRPLVPAADRRAVLEALDCVDAVLVFDEDTPEAALDLLRPDVFVKGGDYAVDSLPETPLLESWGGQVVVLPYLEGRSTTLLLQEVVRRGSR